LPRRCTDCPVSETTPVIPTRCMHRAGGTHPVSSDKRHSSSIGVASPLLNDRAVPTKKCLDGFRAWRRDESLQGSRPDEPQRDRSPGSQFRLFSPACQKIRYHGPRVAQVHPGSRLGATQRLVKSMWGSALARRKQQNDRAMGCLTSTSLAGRRARALRQWRASSRRIDLMSELSAAVFCGAPANVPVMLKTSS
jgi:hypothetical protein